MFTTLISASTLAKHLNDPTFVIVDCRSRLDDTEFGRRAYYEGHIPGAVYAHLEYDLSGWKTGSNGRHPLPSTRIMNATFGAWGIDSSKQVIAYDDGGTGSGSARLWWMLRYMDHNAVAVLDGGWQAWQAEGRPVEEGMQIRPPTTFEGEPRTEMQVEADSLLTSGLTLIDSRSPVRYRGDEEPIDKVAGHIPGSKNIFWSGALGPDGRFLPPDQLRERFQKVMGGTDPSQFVFYCGSGVSAVTNLLALEVIGLSGAKLYAGSWSEWSSDPSRPIAKGEE
jgi:thiosulfate/3-mercaptopyruvate sulfurtransferase